MEIPETRYAKTIDGVHIAYQVIGNGSVDFVYIGPWFTHVENRKDLTAGSGLIFENAGEHELKGVPGRWHLDRVVK